MVVIQSLLECLHPLPVDAAAPTIRLDPFPCRSQVLRLIHSRPVSSASDRGVFPRRNCSVSSRYSLVGSSFPTPSWTAFPDVLIRPHEGRAAYHLRASGTSPSSDFSPDIGRPSTSSGYRRAFARRSLHAEHLMRSPGVTTSSSTPCRPHTPWFEGWMDNAFVAIVPTRPCPLFGRPVHRWNGSHRFRPGASPQALRIPPRGGHPALPDTHRGQRGITPAFGYGAPHPSTSMPTFSRKFAVATPTGRRECDAQWYDPNISIPGRDKNMPRGVMAMARLTRPSLMIYGGTICAGAWMARGSTWYPLSRATVSICRELLGWSLEKSCSVSPGQQSSSRTPAARLTRRAARSAHPDWWSGTRCATNMTRNRAS